MHRYFFDIAQGDFERDTIGVECADFVAARDLAVRTISAIAQEKIPKSGDSLAMTISVRNADGDPVYSGTLTFTGRAMPR